MLAFSSFSRQIHIFKRKSQSLFCKQLWPQNAHFCAFWPFWITLLLFAALRVIIKFSTSRYPISKLIQLSALPYSKIMKGLEYLDAVLLRYMENSNLMCFVLPATLSRFSAFLTYKTKGIGGISQASGNNLVSYLYYLVTLFATFTCLYQSVITALFTEI
jgi:hypothetical protein